MAAAAFPSPGTEYGPCAGDCIHEDCVLTRRQADSACKHCSQPIGFQRRFFNVTPDDEPSWSVLAHESCELTAIDAERATV